MIGTSRPVSFLTRPRTFSINIYIIGASIHSLEDHRKKTKMEVSKNVLRVARVMTNNVLEVTKVKANNGFY